MTFSLTQITSKEVATSGVTVRRDSIYSIYSAAETVLFDTDKADIKSSAAASLQQITASVGYSPGFSVPCNCPSWP